MIIDIRDFRGGQSKSKSHGTHPELHYCNRVVFDNRNSNL